MPDVKPLPPDVLADALQDRVHPASGRLLRAKRLAVKGERYVTDDDLVPFKTLEDQWGKHPECPVEVLPDGSRVWRVPPGTEVQMSVYRGWPRVVVLDVPGEYRDQVAIRYPSSPPDRVDWWVGWRDLRRIR